MGRTRKMLKDPGQFKDSIDFKPLSKKSLPILYCTVDGP